MATGLRPATVDRGRLPVQSRDRRGALSALALLLVVAGALGSALVVYRTGHRTDVLVAAHEIKPGQLISAADFGVDRVASDNTGALIPVASKAGFVGTYAAVGVPAGTLLNRTMFLGGRVLPADGVIIGVVLPVNQRPAVNLDSGDVVRIYEIPKDSGGSGPLTAPGVASNAKVVVDKAKITEVATGSGSGSSGSIVISLLLKFSDAQTVVLAAAAGQIAVGRLPVGTVPGLDFLPVSTGSTSAATPAPTAAPHPK